MLGRQKAISAGKPPSLCVCESLISNPYPLHQDPLSVKDVFYVGEIGSAPDFKDIHFVLLEDPVLSLREHGGIMATLIRRGTPKYAHQSDYMGTHVVECMHRMPVDEIILRKYARANQMTEEEFNDALDALSFAEKMRRFY